MRVRLLREDVFFNRFGDFNFVGVRLRCDVFDAGSRIHNLL